MFGSKTEIAVASVVYNLAGDENLRPNYLRTMMIRGVMDPNLEIVPTLQDGYLKGPGIKIRSFFQWADRNYGLIGMPSGVMSSGSAINIELLKPEIPTSGGQEAWVQEATVDLADYGMWVEQYLLRYRPQDLNKAWTANINDTTKVITITVPGSSGGTYTFTAANFNKRSYYVYAYYSLVSPPTIGALNQGPTVVLAPGDNFPSTDGWSVTSNNTENLNATLNTTVQVTRSYSDGRPDETSSTVTPRTESYNRHTVDYYRVVYLGTNSANEMRNRREFMLQITTKIIGSEVNEVVTTEDDNGVTVTVTTRTTNQVLQDRRTYKIDNRLEVTKSWGATQMFIYRIGSGNAAIDAAVQDIANYGKFFPAIPVRMNNRFLSLNNNAAVYRLAKKAYKKAVDGNFDKLVDNLKDNEDLEDIDYAYIVWGVSINTKENTSKKYVYEFFRKLMQNQIGGPTVFNDWLQAKENFKQTSEAWQRWANAQKNPSNPLYGAPEPQYQGPNPTQTENILRIDNNGTFDTNYDIRLNWAYITQSANITGKGRTGAKKGDIWWVERPAIEIPSTGGRWVDGDWVPGPSTYIYVVRLYNQYADNTYNYLDIVDLKHKNYIYGGKFVEILAKDAIKDTDESGFIVPLHYATYKELSLIDGTQMSTACAYLVLNCYQTRKVRWYERGIFKVLLVVVIAVVSVLFTGGAGFGLLGSHFAVGASLGFTGLTAAIVGSVANALAAMILMSVIDVISTRIFGAAIGAIVGMVFSFVAMQGISAWRTTGSFAINWGDFLKVDNLLKLTDSVGRAYQGFVQQNIIDMNAQITDMQTKAENQTKEMQAAFYKEFGYGMSGVDPMMFVDSNKLLIESSDTFLTRTLMTGSQIAAMSMDMLTDFANLTLALPDAYTT